MLSNNEVYYNEIIKALESIKENEKDNIAEIKIRLNILETKRLELKNKLLRLAEEL